MINQTVGAFEDRSFAEFSQTRRTIMESSDVRMYHTMVAEMLKELRNPENMEYWKFVAKVMEYPAYDPNVTKQQFLKLAGGRIQAEKDLNKLISLYLTKGTKMKNILKGATPREAAKVKVLQTKYRISDASHNKIGDINTMTLSRISSAFPYDTCELLNCKSLKRPVPESLLEEIGASAFPSVLTSLAILSVMPKVGDAAKKEAVVLATAGSVCYAFLMSHVRGTMPDDENWASTLKYAKLKRDSATVPIMMRKNLFRKYEATLTEKKIGIQNLIKYVGFSCDLSSMHELMMDDKWIEVLMSN